MSPLLRRTHTCGISPRNRCRSRGHPARVGPLSPRCRGCHIPGLARSQWNDAGHHRSTVRRIRHGRRRKVRLEYVVQVKGTVVERHAKNPNMDTGAIEIIPTELTILNRTKPLPFAIGGAAVEASEEVRLTHRYLDLRRPQLQEKLFMRHQAALMVRRHLDQTGLWKSKPPFSIAPPLKGRETTWCLLGFTLETGTHCRKARRFSSNFSWCQASTDISKS